MHDDDVLRATKEVTRLWNAGVFASDEALCSAVREEYLAGRMEGL